jgi:hypothetical protein
MVGSLSQVGFLTGAPGVTGVYGKLFVFTGGKPRSPAA